MLTGNLPIHLLNYWIYLWYFVFLLQTSMLMTGRTLIHVVFSLSLLLSLSLSFALFDKNF
ncbi:hypothetical protein BY996DRAFT_6800495 [Phakopsora pachyrhizi]|nr:hypothetical protein BY996DRAFT_6800495 [Phakopsora pachyrhizi]